MFDCQARLEPFDEKWLVVVRVQLFAILRAPVYEVVVGVIATCDDDVKNTLSASESANCFTYNELKVTSLQAVIGAGRTLP